MRASSVAARLFILIALATSCSKSEPGSPEAVADAFADAYFSRADQEGARAFAALGASKMLEEEIAQTRSVRDATYSPGDANLEVTLTRGERSARGERVRFDYRLRFKDGSERHADVELARIEGAWKVVRVGLADAPNRSDG